MRKYTKMNHKRKQTHAMAQYLREKVFTKNDLEDNRREYSENFIKLMETVGQPEQVKYIEIERKLNYRNCLILRSLGMLVQEVNKIGGLK